MATTTSLDNTGLCEHPTYRDSAFPVSMHTISKYQIFPQCQYAFEGRSRYTMRRDAIGCHQEKSREYSA